MVQCHLCHRSHQLKYCPFFDMVGPQLRRRTVEKHKICLNCLAHTHTIESCDSPIRCRHCGGNHHSMIHQPEPTTVDAQSETKQIRSQPISLPALYNAAAFPDENPPQNGSNQPRRFPWRSILAKIDTQALLASLPQQTPIDEPRQPRPSTCYVTPMIKTSVSYMGHEQNLTLMVDTNVRHSQILWEVAKKFPDFQPKVNRAGAPYGQFMVHSFGPKYDYIFQLSDQFNVPEPIGDTRLRAHFNNFVPLAHDDFHNVNTVDIVLSQRSWNKIKKSQAIQNNDNTPTAQATHFGWVIHGSWNGCSCAQHENQSPIYMSK
ncbi:uncharacterized protein [Musca autumnalis]|uniref:uncharacterized protein n=1 Tax=Musca autumnalis TaxID=221902 RepID=UPI003CECEED2